jgi:electron transfer flavoprotein alpha subunit
MNILLWIEHDGKQIHPASYNGVAIAKALGGQCHALVVGDKVDEIASQAARIEGVSEVLVASQSYYFPFRAEPIANLLKKLAPDYSHIIALSSTHSKNIFPRFAGLMDKPMLTDVIKIESPTCFVHPIYAGNALAKKTFMEGPVIATFRASAFEKAALAQKPCLIRSIECAGDDARSFVLFEAVRDEETPDLQTAKIVVSGGRGFGSQENFKMVEKLAKQLGAAVGATRAAVDAGFISNEHQVGQTGKVVAPELYIAIGISGAIQHMAGMKDSKTIVAINRDAEAPIFEIASFGLVGDLFTIVPEIMDELKKLKN